MNQNVVNEINRKAKLGIDLVSPTSASQSIYNQQRDKTTNEIERKALQGTPLVNQNSGANNKYYSQVVKTAPIDPNKYRTDSAGIEDIAKKYGFDFSREGSARQAESEAQAKRDAANQGKRAVDSNIEGSVEALDRNYFQKYMQQSQQQTNNGLNAGIASDQDLRMAMSRQAEMGDIYRDGNLEQMRLQDALGRVEQERLAREDGLHFDRTMAGAGLAQNQDQLSQQENLAMLQAAQNQRGQNIGMEQFDQNFSETQRQFNTGQSNWQTELDRLLGRDERGDFVDDRNFSETQRQFGVGQDNWETEFDRLLGRDKVSDNQFDRNFNWSKESYWNDFNNINASTRASLGEQAASRRQSASNAAAGRASSASNAAASRAASRYEFDNLSGYQQASLAKEAEMAVQAEEQRIKYERKDNWNAFLDKNNKFNLGGR